MTDTEMFIVRKPNTPSILEHYEETEERDTESDSRAIKAYSISKASHTTTYDHVFPTEFSGSKQFINDLVWLKQKLSDIGGQSYDDNSSDGSVSSGE